MKKTTQPAFSAFGASSLLAAFGILCLVVLAMLSITTVQADRRQSQALAQSASDYYSADRQAQNIFARLRQGETVEGVQEEDGLCRYACPVSDTQVLEVEVQKTAEGWQVLKWQTRPTTEYQENETLPVWDGA